MDTEWYEVHNCEGCGMRIPIGGPPDPRFEAMESKDSYNNRMYHDDDCAGLLRQQSQITHGTTWGYEVCRERPEGPCDVCREFNRVRCQPRASARNRALRKLGKMNPEMLENLIAVEQDRMEVMVDDVEGGDS